MSTESTKKNFWRPTLTWVTVAIVSVIWWTIASQGSLRRGVLLVSLSFASLTVGALVGFLFSSYGEENTTLGKIRDWLVGGLTALTVVKAGSIKEVLQTFALGPGPTEFAVAAGAATLYAGLGFFTMFFGRELFLNVWLAERRAERGKLEGSQQAAQVVQQFHVRLPPSVLTGVDYIEEEPDVNEKEVKELRDLLYSSDVEKFLDQAEKEAAKSGAVDWDITSKCAYIHYYRTSFEKEGKHEIAAARKWITRALNMNPLHVDLTMKYAEMLGADEEYASAVAILERLMLREDAPPLIKQWLGYYLRFLPDRLDDAIRYSEEYHRLFSDETDTFFNVFYAYGRKYCNELRKGAQKENLQSDNRFKALSNLQEGLREQPGMAEIVRRWTERAKPLECLRNDKGFSALISPPDVATPAAVVPVK